MWKVWKVPDHYRVRFGGNNFIDTRILVQAHGEPLVTLRRHENGYLGIDFEIFDKAGEKLAIVRRNEIYPAKAKADDYRIDGTADVVTFTEKSTGRVLCEIRKRDAADGQNELQVSARLYTSKGILIDAAPDQITIGEAARITLGGNTISGCDVGLNI